jgi:hypothetical protein
MPAVLRFVTGQVRPDELDTYVAEAHEGTIADAAAGRGPVALYLAPDPSNAFRTLSVWIDWDTLQAATGGDVNRPIATRHAERLLDWEADHYEILPGLVEPGRRPSSDVVSADPDPPDAPGPRPWPR